MARVRVLDLDGSLEAQAALFAPGEATWLAARDWGPRLRLACTFSTFDRFAQWLGAAGSADAPGVTLYGSGDFHHVTLALLRQIERPFNLLVLDKHPDWMRGIPFLHCGTWLHHALRLPALRRVFHCGGAADFDNMYRWLAPWSALRERRVVVLPAQTRWTRSGWSEVPTYPVLETQSSRSARDRAFPPLRSGGKGEWRDERRRDREHWPPDSLARSRTAEPDVSLAVQSAIEPYRGDLAEHPLYISIDKDVLAFDHAAVNWDSGLLRLEHALEILAVFLAAAGGQVVGADLLGDWSPVRLWHVLNRICHRLDHPSPAHDPADAARRNQRVNAALLQALSGAIWVCPK
jgi:hypothetical protein